MSQQLLEQKPQLPSAATALLGADHPFGVLSSPALRFKPSEWPWTSRNQTRGEGHLRSNMGPQKVSRVSTAHKPSGTPGASRAAGWDWQAHRTWGRSAHPLGLLIPRQPRPAASAALAGLGDLAQLPCWGPVERAERNLDFKPLLQNNIFRS